MSTVDAASNCGGDVLVDIPREDDAKLLWAAWVASVPDAGADAEATIHSLDRDTLRAVLRFLPNKERYLSVCKLFRHELPALTSSTSRLRLGLHPTHARRKDLHPLHPYVSSYVPYNTTPCMQQVLAYYSPLTRCKHLTSISDHLGGVCIQGWPKQLRTFSRLKKLALSLSPYNAVFIATLALTLPLCTSLESLRLEADSSDVDTVIAALPGCHNLRIFELEFQGSGSVDFTALTAVPALESLTFSDTGNDDAGVLNGQNAWNTVLQCPNLTSAALTVFWTSVEDIEYVTGRWTPDPVRPAPCAPLESLSLTLTPFQAFLNLGIFVLDTVVADLGKLRALKHLRLSCRQNPTGLILDFAEGALAGFGQPPLKLMDGLSCLPAWPRLQTLQLEFPPNLDQYVAFLSDESAAWALERPVPLRSLALSADVSLPQPFLKQLALRPSPHLAHFALTWHSTFTAHDSNLQQLAAWAATVPTLESLSLRFGMGPHGLHTLAPALRRLTALTHLAVDATGASDLSRLADALPRRRLRSLGVFGLSADAAGPLLTVLPSCGALRVLDLSESKRSVLRTLAAVLPRLPALEELVLRNIYPDSASRRRGCLTAFITAMSCEWSAFARALPRCETLRALRIGKLDNAPRGKPQRGSHGHGNIPGMVIAIERAALQCRVLQELELDRVDWWEHNFQCYILSKRYAALVCLGWAGIGVGYHFGMPRAAFYTLVPLFCVISVPAVLLMFLGVFIAGWVIVEVFRE